MEEAWELAVVSVSYITTLTARHTRLRYQSVLVSATLLGAAWFGVEEVQIPFLIKFESQPRERMVFWSLFVFALFSLGSFILQDILERRQNTTTIKNMASALGGIKSFFSDDGEEPALAIRDTKDILEGKLMGAPRTDEYILVDNDFSSKLASLGSRAKTIERRVVDIESLGEVSSQYFPNEFYPWGSLIRRQRFFLETLDELSKTHWREEPAVAAEKELVKHDSAAKFHLLYQQLEEISGEIDKLTSSLISSLTKQKMIRALHFRILPFWVPMALSCLFIITGLCGA